MSGENLEGLRKKFKRESESESEPSNLEDLQQFHHCDFSSMFANPKFSDLTLTVGQYNLPVHKAFLVGKSPFFSKMIEDLPKKRKIKFQNIDRFALKDSIEYIYTGKIPNKDKMTTELLVAANTFQLNELNMQIQRALSKTITTDNVGDILLHAENYNALQLKYGAMHFIKRNIQIILKNKEFRKLLQANPKLMSQLFCYVNLSE